MNGACHGNEDHIIVILSEHASAFSISLESRRTLLYINRASRNTFSIIRDNRSMHQALSSNNNNHHYNGDEDDNDEEDDNDVNHDGSGSNSL